MLTCGKCGSQNPDNAKFCLQCGAALAEPVAVDETPELPSPAERWAGSPLTAAPDQPAMASMVAAPATPAKPGSSACLPIVIIAVVAVLAIFLSSLGSIGRSSGVPATPTTFEAYYMSQQFVSQQLKAPATAKYPDMYDPAVRVLNTSGAHWTVVAYVDSQNSFGANIRTQYVAVMDWIGGTQWRLVSLNYPGQ